MLPVLLFLFSWFLKSQIYLIPGYGVSLPQWDMAKRFGINHDGIAMLNASITEKMRISGELMILFGWAVKEDRILDHLKTSNGFIIDQNGVPGEYDLQERGYKTGVAVSVQLKGFENGEAGAGTGAGYLWHKIKIVNYQKQIPQVLPPYLYGYDRLTGGPFFKIFGYLKYIRPGSVLRCYLTVECMLAFTRNLRGYNYDTGEYDDKSRHDGLITFILGVPIILKR